MVEPHPKPDPSNDAEDERTAAVLKAVTTLLDSLSESDRQAVLRKYAASAKPISSRKAGEIMGIVLKFIPQKRPWTIGELKDEVLQQHTDANPKDIYNTINYLAKSGRIRRIGHGKYMVDGNLVVSADHFSDEPLPKDDPADD